jgi:hypothetical protein
MRIETNSSDVSSSMGWKAAWALALVWGLGPVLPAILSGGIPGHPFTDLYPAVWGMGWFADHVTSGVPTFAPELGAPTGMPFYYSSPLHGWFAALTRPVLGLVGAYSLGLVLARVATVVVAYGAGKALSLTESGALVFAAVYGCSPFFHGYAVEGIIEGVDGWTLVLWVWLAARGRWGWAVVAAALTVASSWYLAWAGAVAAFAIVGWRWRASASFAAGIALAAPLVYAFTSSFPGGTPLEPAVRAAMGTSVQLFPVPGSMPGLSYAAKTSWIGWIAGSAALVSIRSHPRWAAGGLLAWLASLGVGPLFLLPVWSSIRFPYRLHVLTLLVLGFLAAKTLQGRGRLTWLAACLVVVEALLLSPVEPLIPHSDSEVPSEILALRGKVVLDMPGPLARPPGQMNRSRERARYVLYWGAVAGLRTPWVPDFNAVGTIAAEHPVLDAVRSWDPLERRPAQTISVAQLREAGIDVVVLHLGHLPKADAVELMLIDQGARVVARTDQLVILDGW